MVQQKSWFGLYCGSVSRFGSFFGTVRKQSEKKSFLSNNV